MLPPLSAAAHTYKSRAERYAKSLARSIIRTKGFDGGGQNAYFYDSAEGVITAVILMVSQYCDREERHMLHTRAAMSSMSISAGSLAVESRRSQRIHFQYPKTQAAARYLIIDCRL